jgi:hypothetical protein
MTTMTRMTRSVPPPMYMNGVSRPQGQRARGESHCARQPGWRIPLPVGAGPPRGEHPTMRYPRRERSRQRQPARIVVADRPQAATRLGPSRVFSGSGSVGTGARAGCRGRWARTRSPPRACNGGRWPGGQERPCAHEAASRVEAGDARVGRRPTGIARTSRRSGASRPCQNT